MQETPTIIYHKLYTLAQTSSKARFTSIYDKGAIKSVQAESATEEEEKITVEYADGQKFLWKTKLIDVYMRRKGIAVSFDGKYLFAQTWERGLFCLDPKSGETIWRTKSKQGVTNIFVNKDTVLCHRHGRAFQLLDIHTGEVLAEKRPATDYGFTSLNHDYIICRSTARTWEIINTETLEVAEAFSHKAFTDCHTDYIVNRIELQADNSLYIRGFKNVWDEGKNPPEMLPNETFTHILKLKTDMGSKND